VTAHPRIIVVGASTGGVEALRTVVHGLPADLDAAIFIVLHLPSWSRSRLPAILERAGTWPAAHAVQNETIKAGRIYVAPPDRHLLIRDGRTILTSGPRENHSRPAIDPLFRSAARSHGSDVIGVVLSGALYDGSAGLMAVKARGGIAVVQDPADAQAESMPASAIRAVEVDHVVSAAEIGPLLARLVEQRQENGGGDVSDPDEPIEAVIDDLIEGQAGDDRPEEVTIYTCPDCGGTLIQDGQGGELRFQCHVGHAFAPEVLLGLKAEELEGALWTCVRMLTEKAVLTRQLAARLGGPGGTSPSVIEQAELAERQASVIRELIVSLPSAGDLIESASAAS
jgi:two-component system chemotaxis response regulator CheB